jgi:hypothetical protein
MREGAEAMPNDDARARAGKRPMMYRVSLLSAPARGGRRSMWRGQRPTC